MDSNVASTLKKWRRKPLIDSELGTPIEFDRASIELLLPHRDPMLLLDKLVRADWESSFVVGQYYMNPANPIFKGHFPKQAVYPGALQLEMAGQAALCISYFKQQRGYAKPQAAQDLNIRATKVLGALYLAPIFPGAVVRVIAQELGSSDGFFAQMIGQVLLADQVCSVSMQEVCFIA